MEVEKSANATGTDGWRLSSKQEASLWPSRTCQVKLGQEPLRPGCCSSHRAEFSCYILSDPVKARESKWIPFIVNQLAGGKENLEKCLIVGHSSGAVAAMRLAESYKIYGMLLVAAYTRFSLPQLPCLSLSTQLPLGPRAATSATAWSARAATSHASGTGTNRKPTQGASCSSQGGGSCC